MSSVTAGTLIVSTSNPACSSARARRPRSARSRRAPSRSRPGSGRWRRSSRRLRPAGARVPGGCDWPITRPRGSFEGTYMHRGPQARLGELLGRAGELCVRDVGHGRGRSRPGRRRLLGRAARLVVVRSAAGAARARARLRASARTLHVWPDATPSAHSTAPPVRRQTLTARRRRARARRAARRRSATATRSRLSFLIAPSPTVSASTSKPACSSWSRPLSSSSPTTLGTAVGGCASGPVETFSWTVSPRSSSVPAGWAWATTRPAGSSDGT